MSAPASSIRRWMPSARTCSTASMRAWPNQDPFFSASFDDEATALIARTQSLPIDENGRVRIPDALIEHAGLKDNIVFVGKAQKFQIWDADRYAAHRSRSAGAGEGEDGTRPQWGGVMSGHLPVMLSGSAGDAAARATARIMSTALLAAAAMPAPSWKRPIAACWASTAIPTPSPAARRWCERFGGRLTLVQGEFSRMDEFTAGQRRRRAGPWRVVLPVRPAGARFLLPRGRPAWTCA